MKPIAYSASLALLIALPAAAQSGGDELFSSICANCHGANGQGGQMAPSVISKVKSSDDAALAAFLRTGNPAKGMPPVTVPAEEMPALLGYLRQLAAAAGDNNGVLADTVNHYGSMPAIKEFVPVTDDMLNHPNAADWLWFSRTPDAQRYSPLKQINKNNVKQLGLAWSRGLPDGITETIPTVYRGVLYLTMPGGSVAAFDATTGDMIWHYQRKYEKQNAGGSARSKTLAIYDDMVYFTAPDEFVVALDARTGALRWEAPTPGRGNTSGAIVVKGKVISGGTCNTREACYISAHDAHTGKLVWKFYTTQAPNDPPGVDTWAGTPLDQRKASTWGLPGSFDAETGTLFWSVANPSPYARLQRHNGNPDAIPETAPADLYSNSTLALDPDTGKLKWYYQHLPGDDWDMDINEERVIIRTPLNPDPKYVKWINPDVPKGQMHDIVANVGEGGGLFVLDKRTGKFLWAMPFPSDVDNFILKDIDVHTGATRINRKVVANKPGDENTVCFFNT
ncbi:MAG TPA: PQQ-binding-like beta-propeller repeat protein, partial [Candidatus Acidoferrum sp.]|nr:PQQ-binding-like beta-propeller repeat protein [Candidatus Acidoferrum sp.]